MGRRDKAVPSKVKKIVQDSPAKGCLINDEKIILRQEYARTVLKGLEYHLII